MKEKIIELWRKSGGGRSDSNQLGSYFYINDPEKFASLIETATREACAKLCEDAAQKTVTGKNACINLAAAIRAGRLE